MRSDVNQTDGKTNRSPVLHHVNLKTSRIEKMVEWYCEVTGMRVLFQGQAGVWMTNDAANHRLALLAAPCLVDDPFRNSRNGLHHLAFEFPEFKDLMGCYERLKTTGIMPAFCLDHGMTISMYYQDPDGNFVELQTDIFGSWDKSTAYMQNSPAFKLNPIGEFFDPDLLLKAYRQGGTLEQLHCACMRGAYRPELTPDIGVAVTG